MKFRSRSFLAAAALALSTFTRLVGAEPKSCETMELHAHRGGSVGPENSAQSIKRAAQSSYSAIEVDARRLKDGTWVLHHDPILGRVSGLPGRGVVNVETLTKADWAAVSVRSADGETHKASTLSDALAALGKDFSASKSLHIEIKSRASCGDVERLYRQAQKAVGAQALMFSSFDRDVLSCLRAISPDSYLGLLIGPEPGSVRGKFGSVTGIANALGGMNNQTVARMAQAYDSTTNRELLKSGLDRALSELRPNAGLHLDANTYLANPKLVDSARKGGFTVATYSVSGDVDHQTALAIAQRQGLGLPDVAIIDSLPARFCLAVPTVR